MEYKESLQDIDFRKHWLVLKRNWLPAAIVWSLAIGATAFIATSQKPVYEANGKLRFKKQNTNYALVTEAGEKLGKLDSLNSKDTPLDTEAEVIRSEPIIDKTINELNLKTKEGGRILYEDFIKNLKLEIIRGTDILKISYKDENSEKSRNIVNRLMKVYIDNNILTNRAEAGVAKSFIVEQLPQTEARVREAEMQLRTFKEQNNIVDIEQEAKATVTAVVDIDQQINLTQAEIQKTMGWAKELQNKIGMNSKQALTKNALNQSLALRQVFEKLKQVETQLALERTRFLDDNPVIINLKEKEASLQSLLNKQVKETIGSDKVLLYKSIQIDNINQAGSIQNNLTQSLVNAEAEKKALVEKLASLVQVRSRYKERVNSLPKLEQQQQELQRKVDAAKTSYELLLKNREQLRLAENQNLANAQIVSPGIASKFPVSPDRKIIFALGFAGGSLLFIITAFALELVKSSIKTTEEVKNIFRYPLLGAIPSLKTKSSLIGAKAKAISPEYQVKDSPDSVVAQSYRMLHTKLKWLRQNSRLKIIAITSSIPKEGKSTVSANLAMVLAQLEHQVLLIDADLYNPRQHELWNLTNEVGLSNAIVDQTEWKTAVKQVMPNFDVLPSGAPSSNAFSLLGSERMNSLIEVISRKYDFVIIDTPPLSLIVDALSLTQMCDGLVLVARPGVIDKASANYTRELLEQSCQDVLGLVVNGTLAERDSYFRYSKTYSKFSKKG
ncbi:Fis family transcriptional regulator [Rivularia sp. IAM M-261]|nr:Fis family transcriptional regulator [Rivularia sp. IAM M-261]